MSARPVRATRNHLLEGLPLRETKLLAPLAEHCELAFGHVLCEARQRIAFAVFPNAGIVSLLAIDGSDLVMELGLVGRDGMFGLPLSVGIAESPVRAQVQGAGHAVRFEAVAFGHVLAECATLRERLHRFTYSLMIQVTQTAVCNSAHSLEERAARWMLATGDRMESDRFTLTQAWLAAMLGVQRPAVSHAASALSRAGFIRYSRGQVSILDRPGLEEATCGCYRLIDDMYKNALA